MGFHGSLRNLAGPCRPHTQMCVVLPSAHPWLVWLLLSCSFSAQDFPLLWLDDVMGDQSNVLGFSMLNSSHAFYLDFIRSLTLSWREGCRISPYPGPAVSSTPSGRAGLQPLGCWSHDHSDSLSTSYRQR